MNVVMELMRELRKCIKELGKMYEMMEKSYEGRRKEEVARSMAYNEAVQMLINRDLF